MQKHRGTSRRGFTLIELILVLAVIACVIGIVAPSLRGFSAGSRLRDTADHFVTLTRLARVRALSTGQVHRVTIDTAGNRCVVAAEVGQQLEEIDSGMNGSFEIPEGVSIQILDQQQGAGRNSGNNDHIEFYANGRTQAMKLRVSLENGESYLEIECVAPTEGFYVVQPGAPK